MSAGSSTDSSSESAKKAFSDQSVPYVHPDASIAKQIKVEASISLF